MLYPSSGLHIFAPEPVAEQGYGGKHANCGCSNQFFPINCKETKNVAKEIVLWARENEKSSAELTVGRRGSGVALVS